MAAGGYPANGAGLYGCDGAIQNNTIVDNSAADSGGLADCRGTIINCIIWGNAPPEGAQLYDSAPPYHCCIEDWTAGGEGNTSDNPEFVKGSYRLQAHSPCIDAGVNYYWFAWPQRDLDGNCRLAGPSVDMGCYEYDSSPDRDGDLLSDQDEAAANTDPEREDTDGDGLRDGLEALRGSDLLSPTPAAVLEVPSGVPTVQGALCLAVNGDEIVVAPGIYPENIRFCGTEIILRSSEPENSDIVASTVLDGDRAGPVVSFAGNESQECVLSGFTVRNGEAAYGGGIQG